MQQKPVGKKLTVLFLEGIQGSGFEEVEGQPPDIFLCKAFRSGTQMACFKIAFLIYLKGHGGTEGWKRSLKHARLVLFKAL